VFIGVKAHDKFLRDGADLHCELAVPFPLAALGGTAHITLIGGERQEVEVPAGMQPGDSVRLREQGVPRLGRQGTGDLLVHLTVQVPQRLKKPQRDSIEALAEHLSDDAELTIPGGRQRETRNKKKGAGIFDRIRDALDGE